MLKRSDKMRPKLDRSDCALLRRQRGNGWLPPLRLSLSESQKFPQFIRKVSRFASDFKSLANLLKCHSIYSKTLIRRAAQCPHLSKVWFPNPRRSVGGSTMLFPANEIPSSRRLHYVAQAIMHLLMYYNIHHSFKNMVLLGNQF